MPDSIVITENNGNLVLWMVAGDQKGSDFALQ